MIDIYRIYRNSIKDFAFLPFLSVKTNKVVLDAFRDLQMLIKINSSILQHYPMRQPIPIMLSLGILQFCLAFSIIDLDEAGL